MCCVRQAVKTPTIISNIPVLHTYSSCYALLISPCLCICFKDCHFSHCLLFG